MSFCFNALKSSTLFNQIILENLEKEGFTGLSPALLGIFAHLAEADPLSVSALANALGVSRQAMHKNVTTLERLGYIALQQRPTNKKEKIVVLTEEGERLVKRALDTIAKTEEQMADFLGEEAYEQFLAHQQKLTAFLEGGC